MISLREDKEIRDIIAQGKRKAEQDRQKFYKSRYLKDLIKKGAKSENGPAKCE